MIKRAVCALLWLCALATPAHATWQKASSDHFVIYADQPPEKIRKFADRLERYHDAMRIEFNFQKAVPSPSNRVTVFVVGSVDKVQEIFGKGGDFVQGFYKPRAGGSIAIIPQFSMNGEEASESERVLYHEYAHHFMFTATSYQYPLWVVEGFAEFYGTSRFDTDGSVSFGLMAEHRQSDFTYGVEVPINELVDTASYLKNKDIEYDSFYGQAWLLFHYLQFKDGGREQLAQYLKLTSAGKPEIEAAKTAFGDLSSLSKELRRYMKNRKWSYRTVGADKINVGSIEVTPLSAGASEMMPIKIMSKNGVDEKQAAELLPRARKVGSKYPNDPAVQAALAEAEFDAGHDEEAIAAADRALAIEPQNIEAEIQRGYALARVAEKSEDKAAAWAAVRKQFVTVNKQENNNPISLVQYYLTFKEQGVPVPEKAVEGLEWALELARYDIDVRMLVVSEQIASKRWADARANVLPLAYNAHSERLREQGTKLLEKIDNALAGKEQAPEDAPAAQETKP